MQLNKLNLCTAVRGGLIAAGYSPVRVLDAVNASLGKMGAATVGEKSGDVRSRAKRAEFVARGSVTIEFTGKYDIGCHFAEFNDKVAKAEKVAAFDAVTVPPTFVSWLDKFAKADKAPATAAEAKGKAKGKAEAAPVVPAAVAPVVTA